MKLWHFFQNSSMTLRDEKKTIIDEWCVYFHDMAFVTIAKCTEQRRPRLNNCVSVNCLSKICFLYCRWKAKFSSERPTKLSLHQVGSSNNILNKVCHVNGLWFPFSIQNRRPRQSNLQFLLSARPTLSVCPTLFLCPIPILIPSTSSLTFLSLFFLLFLFSSSPCLPPGSFSSHCLPQTLPESFPDTKHGAGCCTQLWKHRGGEGASVCSRSLQLMAIPRQNGNCRIFRLTPLIGEKLGLILWLYF